MEETTTNVIRISLYSLNPYYNGRYSWRDLMEFINLTPHVLILIIMEDTHGEMVRA